MPGLGVSPPVRTLPQALLRGVEGGQELSKPSCICRVGAQRSSWVQVLSWQRGQRGEGVPPAAVGLSGGQGSWSPSPQLNAAMSQHSQRLTWEALPKGQVLLQLREGSRAPALQLGQVPR